MYALALSLVLLARAIIRACVIPRSADAVTTRNQQPVATTTNLRMTDVLMQAYCRTLGYRYCLSQERFVSGCAGVCMHACHHKAVGCSSVMTAAAREERFRQRMYGDDFINHLCLLDFVSGLSVLT